jgi:nitrile hydratase beta subunit
VNSVADMGGIDGFGPVQREPDEPVFHQPWEGRVFGMLITVALTADPVDAFRPRLERLDPAQYLSSSYYERFLSVLEGALVEAGTLSHQEIEAKIQQFAADPNLPVPRREDPTIAANIAATFQGGNPASRKIRQKPRFAVGDKILTRNLNPHGHTRLPRYTRGKRGIVVAHHGAHVFPDSNAHGLGENPQHLYTVRIAAQELWGDNAEPNENVLIDLWESYLEKDRTAVKTPAGKTGPKIKKLVSKDSARPAKALAQAKRAVPSHPPSVTVSSRSMGHKLTTPLRQKGGRGKSGKAKSKSKRATGKGVRVRARGGKEPANQ